MITLRLRFHYNVPYQYISVNCAGVLNPEEQPKSENGLSLEMELRDTTRGDGAYTNAFCQCDHELPQISISKTRPCECLVRFHGRYFPITRRHSPSSEAVLCFEFPTTASGDKELPNYMYADAYPSSLGATLRLESCTHRIRVRLRQQEFLSEDLWSNLQEYTFSILPSTKQLQTEVGLSTPAHVQRLLSSHGLSGAIPPDDCPGPFDHILARSLKLDHHCIPLSSFSSPEILGIIYCLYAATRQSMLSELYESFRHYSTLVQGNKGEQEYLQGQYSIVQLVLSLQGPICYLPSELLSEIFLISVEMLGVRQNTLQEVCQTWRALVAHLWGELQLGTWTSTPKIAPVVNQGPRSLDVVIDTGMDETPSGKPYSALAFAWTSASRWRSLKIKSFPIHASMPVGNIPFSFHTPFINLESLFIGPGCDFSNVMTEIMDNITSTITPKLTSLIFTAPRVFHQLNNPYLVRIYPHLTVLELAIRVQEPVDLLHHCAHLEVMKLSGVILQPSSLGDELPCLRTLRHIWLKRSSIQWMSDQIFQQVKSCILLRPVDPHSIGNTRTISLPACNRITVQSRSIKFLAAFHAPLVDKIEIECNQWSRAGANLEFSRLWTRRCNQRIIRPKVLSLKICCSDQLLLDALQLLDLEELVLELPHPSALGACFFRALCGVPTQPFTGRTIEEWKEWTVGSAGWQPKICPSLHKLQLHYERWLRDSEMDAVMPLFIAVAWSRRELPSPLWQFNLKLGMTDELQLVGMTHQDNTFVRLWQGTQMDLGVHPNGEEVFYASLMTSINQSIGFVTGKFPFIFQTLDKRYYSSFFRHLRTFYCHLLSHRPYSCDVLPYFEHLEELYIINFHLKPCPVTASLPLCRTLRILHTCNAPLNWMDGRTFKHVVECRVAVNNDWHFHKLSRVEMPACLKMEFNGSRYLGLLSSFHLPRLDLLFLNLEHMQVTPGLVQNIVLPIRSIRPRVLEVSTKPEDRQLVMSLQTSVSRGVLVKLCGPVAVRLYD
jgi:hypothetical protein